MAFAEPSRSARPKASPSSSSHVMNSSDTASSTPSMPIRVPPRHVKRPGMATRAAIAIGSAGNQNTSDSDGKTTSSETAPMTIATTLPSIQSAVDAATNVHARRQSGRERSAARSAAAVANADTAAVTIADSASLPSLDRTSVASRAMNTSTPTAAAAIHAHATRESAGCAAGASKSRGAGPWMEASVIRRVPEILRRRGRTYWPARVAKRAQPAGER